MKNILNKLITNEDPFHFHKSIGMFVLINFIFQTGYFFIYKEMILNYYILAPHFLLNISSLMFKVLSKRPVAKRMNMFIWEELRLHALVFSYRSLFCVIFPKYKYVWVILTMIFADLISDIYGTKGISTVRGRHEKVGSRSLFKELSGMFFSISQYGGTLICSGCFQPFLNKELVFLTLPAIQTSPFGMTLIRKNLMNKMHWSYIYSCELIIVYLAWFKLYSNLNLFFYSSILFTLRKIGINKYIIWLSVFFINKNLKF